MTRSSQEQPFRCRPDVLTGLALFAVAAFAGMVYVATWGGTPSFYQNIFGPAVMFASGRGYVNPDARECPALEAFLHPKMRTSAPPETDVFPRSALPERITTKPFDALQKRELYLLWSAGLVWRVMGVVAWSALLPLYGALYGTAAVALYGLFRLAMARGLAAACAALLIVSPIQLQNLVRLRDYSKAPFMLAAILLMGLLVKRPMKWPGILGCALACGAVVGVGLGFRFDVLICVAAFVPVTLFLLPGKVTEGFLTKVGAVALFFAAFLATSWPVVSQLPAHGDKCVPALMGLAQLYDDRLGVDSDYQLVHRYLDAEPLAVILAHGAGKGDAVLPARMETPEYERIGDAFYGVVLKTFPADLAIRAYAAVLRILDELRAGLNNPLPRNIINPALAKLFEGRALLVETVFSRSRYAVLLVLLLLAARDLRVAFGACFLLLFFCGYTANQFASRNYFHLEFFGIWAGGFLLMRAFELAQAAVSREGRARLTQAGLRRDFWVHSLGRVAVFVLVVSGCLAALLWSLRWYQSRQVYTLLKGYDTAELEPLPFETAPLDGGRLRVTSPPLARLDGVPAAPGIPDFRYEYLMAEFDMAGHEIAVRAAYAGNVRDSEPTWDIRLPQTASAAAPAGTTRLFFPAYYLSGLVSDEAWTAFKGLELDARDAAALKALHRVRHPGQFPVLLTAVLPPDWPSRPRYQRLVR